MSAIQAGYQTVSVPKVRRLMADGGQLGRRRHIVHGLFEVDVTRARQALRDHEVSTGEALSFTGFVISCLGQAIERNKYMHAYRDWRGRLVLFDQVDVNTMFEVEVDGRRIIRPHVIRAANQRSLPDIHAEIRNFQTRHRAGPESRFIERFVLLPGFVRRAVLAYIGRRPSLQKHYAGTVLLTALGMFAEGAFWGIPVPNHTLQITLGGIGEKPGVVDGRIEVREYLSVTISFDHDIVDGAPATRFAQHFKELIESGVGLADQESP